MKEMKNLVYYGFNKIPHSTDYKKSMGDPSPTPLKTTEVVVHTKDPYSGIKNKVKKSQ